MQVWPGKPIKVTDMVLDRDEACLIVRQNPKQALGTPEHKEKCKPTLDAISFEFDHMLISNSAQTG